MLPVPVLPTKRPNNSSKTPGVVVWIAPFVFVVPCMVAVGVARVIAPKSREDWDRYLRALSALLTESLSKAVEYRTAGQSRHRCNTPTRDRTLPTGATRPGGKPGASRTAGRGRARR